MRWQARPWRRHTAARRLLYQPLPLCRAARRRSPRHGHAAAAHLVLRPALLIQRPHVGDRLLPPCRVKQVEGGRLGHLNPVGKVAIVGVRGGRVGAQRPAPIDQELEGVRPRRQARAQRVVAAHVARRLAQRQQLAPRREVAGDEDVAAAQGAGGPTELHRRLHHPARADRAERSRGRADVSRAEPTKHLGEQASRPPPKQPGAA